jgi:hypothetical protein
VSRSWAGIAGENGSSLWFVRWLTLGNQLGADQIYEEDMAERIKAR